MLRQLLIENYGLIDRAEIEFSDGATMFTGETGSGKTMLLGALGFVLGERATTDAVRTGASRASVTLTFDASDTLLHRFNGDGFDLDNGEDGILVRDVAASGKSSLRLNGRPATASYVREIAADIADIIGQHDAQRLLAPNYHVDLLDRFSGSSVFAARERVRTTHERFQTTGERLAALEGDDRRARVLYEEAKFALEEIEAARVVLGEEERLTERRRFLDNVERVAEALRIAHDALSAESSGLGEQLGASSAIGAGASALHGIATISPALAILSDRIGSLQEEANDLATEIARELEATEFNPGELERIHARLETLDHLKRKYGGTLDAVLAQAERFGQSIADFDGRDERLLELRAQRENEKRELADAAGVLSELRHAGAKKIVKAVTAEFSDLALAAGRFDVSFELLDTIGPDGAERIEFMFAANAGQPLRPLARVASGGELSRVLLALVVVGMRAADAAFVFDEIDTGIGGATATAVAARLSRLAASNQVVCVTHLAQIAGRAKSHYVLEKIEKKNVTTIGVRKLGSVGEREAELARMLSGETHEVALKHARTLLNRVKG